MVRTIDADALKDSLKWGWVNDKFVLRKIDECPEVDAVAVVRCKDCRHSRVLNPLNNRMLFCDNFRCGIYADGYCHCGAKREVNDED